MIGTIASRDPGGKEGLIGMRIYQPAPHVASIIERANAG
jgi:hypothetical protein